METMNHECYVSLEVAKLLKQAGFDWEVKSYRKGLNGIFETTSIPNNFNDGTLTDWISAPTIGVAQRWLREKWDLIITIEYSYYSNKYTVKVYSKAECLSILFDFLLYEEAQEAGIKKALEIMLEKGE